MAQTAILGKEITIEISEAMLIASRFAEVNGHAAGNFTNYPVSLWRAH